MRGTRHALAGTLSRAALTALGMLLPALWLVGATAAGEFEGALAALERGEFATAIPTLEVLAEAGDPRAHDTLAAMYLQGIGVEADLPRAMQWYCRVAHDPAGGRPAMHAAWFLAEYFRTGGGVPGSHYLEGNQARSDPIRAYFWFLVMANQSGLYKETHADSVTLGKIGVNAVGRELYAEEKAGLARALAAWHPSRPVRSGEECLALPEGLAGE